MLGYIPVDRPRVAVAQGGTVAAIHEPTRLTFVGIPDGAPFAMVPLDVAATGIDVAWLERRLLVLARFPTHSLARVIEPSGARVLAERRLEAWLHLRASVDGHALVTADTAPFGVAILAFVHDHLVVNPFPTRVVPVVVGTADAKFVITAHATIDEWDPVGLIAQRRLRLPATSAGATVTAVGGSARVAWWTTREAPRRIDVLPLVTRGQPRTHELPEPIAQIAGQPHSDLLACLGADTGRVYVVDLDGRAPLRVLDTTPVTHAHAVGLVVGPDVRVLVSEATMPTTLVSLDASPARATPPIATWRDEVVAWTRSGLVDRVLVIPAVDALAHRLGIPAHLTGAITLCYGAHLCGAPGVAPVDLAHLLGGRWDEALGAGQLAKTDALIYARSRITLAPAYAQLLDDLP
ncbi:MAG: hypothetical protein NT062_32445 [Proteobacteria bacterium]|nr:hypothetical protein [Pseudomonadota bacterium]